jgi:methyl-accepting chemotaxis protein
MAGQEHHVEADAFDGKDAEFANTEMHDASGRYMSYWAWHDGKPQQSTMTDYTEAADGSADWYGAQPRQAAQGQRTLCLRHRRPAGADEHVEHADHRKRQVPRCFTVDFSAALQKHLATLMPMGAGRVELLSPKGVVLASANAAEIGKPRSDALTRSMLADIAADRRFEAFTPDAAGNVRVRAAARATPAALRAGRGDAACGDRAEARQLLWLTLLVGVVAALDPQRRCLRAAAPLAIRPLAEAVRRRRRRRQAGQHRRRAATTKWAACWRRWQGMRGQLAGGDGRAGGNGPPRCRRAQLPHGRRGVPGRVRPHGGRQQPAGGLQQWSPSAW